MENCKYEKIFDETSNLCHAIYTKTHLRTKDMRYTMCLSSSFIGFCLTVVVDSPDEERMCIKSILDNPLV
jgi:hypothetical protein